MILTNTLFKTVKKFPLNLKRGIEKHDYKNENILNNSYFDHFDTYSTTGSAGILGNIFHDIESRYRLTYIDVIHILIVILTPSKIKSIPDEYYIKELEVAYFYSLTFGLYCMESGNHFNDNRMSFSEYNIERFLYVLKAFFSYDEKENNCFENFNFSKNDIMSDFFQRSKVSRKETAENSTFLFSQLSRNRFENTTKYNEFILMLAQNYINNPTIRDYIDNIVFNNVHAIIQNDEVNNGKVSDIYHNLIISKKILLALLVVMYNDNNYHVNKSVFQTYITNYINFNLYHLRDPIEENFLTELENSITNRKDQSIFKNTNKELLLFVHYVLAQYFNNNEIISNLNLYSPYFKYSISQMMLSIISIIRHYKSYDIENSYVNTMNYFLKNCDEKILDIMFNIFYPDQNNLIVDYMDKEFKNRWNKMKLTHDNQKE